MGIGFYCKHKHFNCGRSYSGFHNFRQKLAKSLNLYFDFDMTNNFSAWPRHWKIFFTHSDYDGYFTPAVCKKLAPEIMGVILLWPKDDFDRDFGERLCMAMNYCYENKIKLEIC